MVSWLHPNPDYATDDIWIARMRLTGTVIVCVAVFSIALIYLGTVKMHIQAELDMSKQKWETAVRLAEIDRKMCKMY